MTAQPRTDGPARELTPDEIVADIEAMKPRKGKVTIYQSWPRMILERERKRAEAAAPASGLREALLKLCDNGYQQRYNGRPSCPFCDNFVDDEETHGDGCILVAALAASTGSVPASCPRCGLRDPHTATLTGAWITPEQHLWPSAASVPAPLDVERLALALISSAEHVNYPKAWAEADLRWLARQIAAAYSEEKG